MDNQRLYRLLIPGAECLSDFIRDDYQVWTEDWLPPLALQQPPEWHERFAQRVQEVCKRLAAGDHFRADCTADQVILHEVIVHARSYRENLGLKPSAILESAEDVLLDDLDHELLYDPAFDGVESDAAITAGMGIEHLHPRDWFEPWYTPETT